ncbi:ABC transporter ATP-binding protein [Oceanirhabdus sp. W0125-5]|uniref:ABC transporter ATP-binding protein n=1 Tax=Oceanirhabdus sp. W0125-5 TaxID=2999116 RepID=UPI0022F2F7FD|nr:ABC transporter ATP-binding protein [Oceanirhabdus sp. W0125-5]WBW97037.1 ABC transporter ATP-binding protein [Oceanirhabdus sp. W0125-5]
MIYLFKKAWKYSGEDRWKVIVFYILHTISYSGELLQPFAFGKAINSLQINGVEYLSSTLRWFGLYLVGFFVFQIFHHTARFFEMTTAYRNQQRFINDMYSKVYNLPMRWHTDHHSGEVVNRINTAGLAIRNFGFAQYEYLGNFLLSLGPVIVLTIISWKISAICLTLTTVNLVVVQKMNKIIHPILERQNEHSHAYAARLIDFVGNIKTIISLRLKKETSKELDKKFDGYYKEHMNEFWINQPRCFIIGLGGIVTEFAIILYYLWACRISGEAILVGTFILIINYYKQMRDAFFQITSNFYETLRWKADIESVNPILQSSCEYESDKIQEGISLWNQVSIRNLNFKYDKEKDTLQNIDMDITNDSKIAIVGLSGCGKSTLINILAGFYEPEEVKLFIEYKEYSQLNILSNSAMLAPQDVEIFENTLEYNITFGLDADKGELEKVIDIARLNEVIERLPKGIKTDIREKGVNLSGGEKQRLALARALFFSKGKNMLLLDEVTSNVDAFNERLIFKELFKAYNKSCVICTIHRLHLLDMFDTVVVMDNGRILQKGSFSKLIKTEGYFKKLWEMYLIKDMELEEDLTYNQDFDIENIS